MNPRKSLAPVICLLFCLAVQPPLTEGRTPFSVQAAEDSCLPLIRGQHFQFLCFEQAEARLAAAPSAETNCGSIASLTHQERYIALSCAGGHFQGYFAPSEWTVTTIQGDGGVDVTGAPNALLVEGANNATVRVSPGRITRMQILIPAYGILTFGYRHVGGSNLSPAMRVLVDGRLHSGRSLPGGEQRFRLSLHQGASLMMEFEAPASGSVQISDFQLESSAQAVLERVWTATDNQGRSSSFTQFISLEHPNLTDVRIPEEMAWSADSAQEFSPEDTGFPYIDRDGDPNTLEDRFPIRPKSCAFDVQYTDEVRETPGGLVLFRRWKVLDACNDNRLEATQLIRLSPPADENTPDPGHSLKPGGPKIGHPAPAGPHAQSNQSGGNDDSANDKHKDFIID